MSTGNSPAKTKRTTLPLTLVSRARVVLFILSHPDYNRRLWVFTRSADLDESSARGLTLTRRNTAGGEFRPALRIIKRLLK